MEAVVAAIGLEGLLLRAFVFYVFKGSKALLRRRRRRRFDKCGAASLYFFLKNVFFVSFSVLSLEFLSVCSVHQSV